MKKSYIILLIVVFASFRVNGYVDICDMGVEEVYENVCHTSPLPDKYPETVEELRKVCRSTISILNCYYNSTKDCDWFYHEAPFRTKITEYLNRVCEEDSPVFSVISSNLDCIVPVAKTMPPCLGEYVQTSKIMHESLKEAEDKLKILNKEYEEDSDHCIADFIEMSCPGIRIGLQCGDEVGNAILEMLEETDYPLWICGDEVLEQLRPLQGILKLVIEEEIIRSALKMRK